jgi:hypothetical protein
MHRRYHWTSRIGQEAERCVCCSGQSGDTIAPGCYINATSRTVSVTRRVDKLTVSPS